MRFFKKSGEIILESDEIDLKIASDRDIYIRKDKSKQYKNINHKIPVGLSIADKEGFLWMLRKELIQNEDKREEKSEDGV